MPPLDHAATWVGVHLLEVPDLGLVAVVADGAVGAVRDALGLRGLGLLGVGGLLGRLVEDADVQEFGLGLAAQQELPDARLVDDLLEIDYTDVEKPKRGRWGIDAAIAKRRNAIDLTLIQAATGLRVGEANKIKPKHVEVTDDGTMLIHATREVIKGGGNRSYSPRTVPVLDERVAERILARCNERGQEDRIIGSPTKPSTVWDESNCQDETQALYQELARDCDVPLFETARTHVWRHTLNTVLLAEVPEVVRAAFFGHTTDVNRSRYTDLSNAHTMIRAVQRLSIVQTGSSGLDSGLAGRDEMISDAS